MDDNDNEGTDYPTTLMIKFLSHLFTICELDFEFLFCSIYVMRD